jgi:hypothetical protein
VKVVLRQGHWRSVNPWNALHRRTRDNGARRGEAIKENGTDITTTLNQDHKTAAALTTSTLAKQCQVSVRTLQEGFRR